MLIRFETIKETSLLGHCVQQPVFSPEETSTLWRGFRGKIREMNFPDERELWSVQVHQAEHTGRILQRWAAAEMDVLAPGFEALEIPSGLYAVFLYRGGMAGFESFLINAFEETLPSYSLSIDNRPHFQLLGKGFNPFSEESEEEVWIPVKLQKADREYRMSSIAAISSLLSLGQRMDELRLRMELALETGFSLSDVKEIILQICLYAGFPRSLNGMACLRDLMEGRNRRGDKTEEGKNPSPQPEGISRFQLGWDTLQSLDPDFIHRLKAGLDPVSPELFGLVLEHGYADIFYRDNLDILYREVAVIAALVAVENADPQLSFHIQAGMGLGISRSETESIIRVAAQAAGRDAAKALALMPG